jgi:enediyne biosynthesis protein E4
MGIGARVHVYPAGKLGDAKSLLGCREIATGYGYASGQPAVAHFGVGQTERVDITVTLPHGKGMVTRQDLPANQRVTLKATNGR